jgi:hypothetical protein
MRVFEGSQLDGSVASGLTSDHTQQHWQPVIPDLGSFNNFDHSLCDLLGIDTKPLSLNPFGWSGHF